ncbi:response regulator [Streptomyces dangxiongensis]|uniref:response regulator n=1 Tax=Streptomyces dangxiongensis TaxID=1442032 RepID=UPI0026C4B257
MRTHATAAPSRHRVLVVEDDDTIGRHLETGLRGNGYTPTWSRTGSAALAETAHTPYDVLLLDLGLPDIDGLDVARAVRARHPDLLIVILTARTDDIDVIAGLDAGADDYLVKPFSLTVLLARLRAHLRHRVVATPPQQPLRLADLDLDVVARRCRQIRIRGRGRAPAEGAFVPVDRERRGAVGGREHRDSAC